ncbi:DUF6939 family protein [Kitasatospora sp. LaBMicrA B282]|uniref:DUF6939 family protein n=1 Tax=Kitasatospora sp. LaBMicrA B282 TaxID=3420949 RepID=UPI003D0DDC85
MTAAGHRPPPARCRAVSRPEGLALAGTDVLRVDTAAAAPADMRRFVTMNPFHFDPAWRIPVPGSDHRSCSMESVWQAQKLVDGCTDPTLFERPPVKRPPDDQRGAGFDYRASAFRYDDRVLDLVSARYLVYLPAYLYLLEHLVPEPVVQEITGALAAGREVVFYDWDENHDIEESGSSFSHSAILAAWFGGRLAEEFLRRRDRWLADHPDLPTTGTDPFPLTRYQRLHRH